MSASLPPLLAPTAADSTTVSPAELPIAPLFSRMLDAVTAVAGGSFDSFIRSAIAFLVIGAMLWLEWASPEPQAYVPPGALLGAAGLVTGYYLTGDASPVMKGTLSLLYVFVFFAFMLRIGWAPDFIVGQVTTVMGIWYGQRKQTEKVTELTAALVTATNGKDAVK